MLSWSDGEAVRATLRRVDGLSVIALGGPLDLSEVPFARHALDAVLRQRPHRLVVDLGAVTRSDNAGVLLLEEIRRRAGWHGAELWLAAPPEHVRERLDRAGLIRHYPQERSTERIVEILRLRQSPPRQSTPGRQPNRRLPQADPALRHRTA